MIKWARRINQVRHGCAQVTGWVRMIDVEKQMPKETILISNMRCNGIKKVVVNDNSWRSIQPLEPKDVVLIHRIIPAAKRRAKLP